MDAQQRAIAEKCLNASYDATIDFPIIVRTLIDGGFEGYMVDYRRGTTTYYLPGGSNVELINPGTAGAVATDLEATAVRNGE